MLSVELVDRPPARPSAPTSVGYGWEMWLHQGVFASMPSLATFKTSLVTTARG